MSAEALALGKFYNFKSAFDAKIIFIKLGFETNRPMGVEENLAQLNSRLCIVLMGNAAADFHMM